MELDSAKSPAYTVHGPFFFSEIEVASRENDFSRTRFRLRMMSVTSSVHPGMVENSWLTPLIFTDAMAAPSIEERRTRRSELPIVRA